MKREHFFIVGAQRSSTTFLYNLLDQHPSIQMARPVQPEPKFFLDDDMFSCGLDFYEHHFFNADRGVSIWGEKSTSYIESETAAMRIHECYPGARLVFVLRDPIDRAMSNYRFSVDNGFETLPMWDAFFPERPRQFDPKSVSASPYAYLARGHYINFIRLYERCCPASPIKIILQEALIKDIGVVRDLYRFLGVDSNFTPGRFEIKVNESKSLQSGGLTGKQFKSLRQLFAVSIEQLAAHCNLDLSEWPSVRV